MVWNKLWAGFLLVVAVLLPSVALAQKPVTVHVIALDSDDASEDQADALTAAIRTRVRNAPSLQLAESNQSLATLLPALKCPTRPDSACLQRIGDQLKTDRFFWGNVVKGTVAHQVVAEVHLWTRGRPEQVAKEIYSDNLKDQNDDALKRIAVQLFERLTGQSTQGSVLVHATGAQTGSVLVDGRPAGTLVNGQATVQVSSGPHSIDIQADGMTTTAQQVSVVVNVQSEVTFELKAMTIAPVEPTKPSHAGRTVGFITLGVAGASAIAGGILAGLFANDSGQFNTFRESVSTNFTKPCSDTQQRQNLISQLGGSGVSIVNAGCSHLTSANTEGSLAWSFAGAAVGLAIIGALLIATDHGKEAGPPAPQGARLRVLPTFGPGGGGVTALVTF